MNAIKTKAVKSDISDIWPAQWQDGHSEYLAGNSDVPLTWAEPGRVPVTGPAIHASIGPATAVACLYLSSGCFFL